MSRQHLTRENYTPSNSIGHLTRQAAKRVTAGVEAQFAQAEVSFIQWAVLVHLRDGLANTAAELSQSIVHDSGALTRVIDQLEQRGLLIRQRSVVDRRLVGLALTEAGRRTVNTLVPGVVDYYNAVLSEFTEAEVASLGYLLKKFIAALSREARERQG